MKSAITSTSFALLCSLLSLDTASAFMGFSFGNLLFAVNMCHLPGPKCHVDCNKPLHPKNYCENQCGNSSSNRRLDDSSSSSGTTIMWSQAACESIGSSSPYYEKCIAGATADCEEALDEEYSYEAYSDNTDGFSGNTNSSNGGFPDVTKLSFLPYLIAASVATMFVMLYAWKKRRDDKQLRSEDLLADEVSMSGAVARRFERATTFSSPPPAVIGGESGVDYALA